MCARWMTGLTLLLLLPGFGLGQGKKLAIVVEGGKHDLENVPVTLPLSIPKEQLALSVGSAKDADGKTIRGQFTWPSLHTEGIAASDKKLLRRDFHFILPSLKAGAKANLVFELGQIRQDEEFFTLFVGLPKPGKAKYEEWMTISSAGGKEKGRHSVRFWNAAYDNSTQDARNGTYKVFHHLFDPAGKVLVTNGGHTDPHDDPKKLVYPHHRGLSFAFNKITYGEGKKADTWHCTGDAHQSFKLTAQLDEGPIMGRHRVVIAWHGEKDEIFAQEERELTIFKMPGGNLVEFASRLKTAGGKVMLDGDPQHAGFQFRAANEVADKTAKQTYFLRPDGKGEPGQTRNWDPKTKKGPVDLPWNAMSFVLGEKRYTVAYLDHPKNPGEKRWSERDYGRFGCYFEHELTKETPLLVRYRIWLQNGEMAVEQVENLSRAFVSPPKASVQE